MRLAGPPLLAWLAAKARGGVIGRAHSFGGSVESTDPQSPREQCGAVGKRKALHTPPLPASTPLSIPTCIPIDLLQRETKSCSACKRAQKYICASRGRAPPVCKPRALPSHLLELRDMRSSSVLHRGCETKHTLGAQLALKVEEFKTQEATQRDGKHGLTRQGLRTGDRVLVASPAWIEHECVGSMQ